MWDSFRVDIEVDRVTFLLYKDIYSSEAGPHSKSNSLKFRYVYVFANMFDYNGYHTQISWTFTTLNSSSRLYMNGISVLHAVQNKENMRKTMSPVVE